MRILIGVDDSPESRDAILTAFDFFGPDADYTIASVGSRATSSYGAVFAAGYSAGGYVSAAELTKRFEAAEDAAEALARSAKDQAGIADVEIRAELGHAGVQLCQMANDENSDLIVIGSQDKNIWQRLFDPSVGRFLIDHSPCPVLVVR